MSSKGSVFVAGPYKQMILAQDTVTCYNIYRSRSQHCIQWSGDFLRGYITSKEDFLKVCEDSFLLSQKLEVTGI